MLFEFIKYKNNCTLKIEYCRISITLDLYEPIVEYARTVCFKIIEINFCNLWNCKRGNIIKLDIEVKARAKNIQTIKIFWQKILRWHTNFIMILTDYLFRSRWRGKSWNAYEVCQTCWYSFREIPHKEEIKIILLWIMWCSLRWKIYNFQSAYLRKLIYK